MTFVRWETLGLKHRARQVGLRHAKARIRAAAAASAQDLLLFRHLLLYLGQLHQDLILFRHQRPVLLLELLLRSLRLGLLGLLVRQRLDHRRVEVPSQRQLLPIPHAADRNLGKDLAQNLGRQLLLRLCR
jgi:hypothetical protein